MLAIDFETFYDKDYSLRKMSTWDYVYHEKFDAYLVAAYDKEKNIKWVGHPKDFDWSLCHGEIILMHNASFDELVFIRLQEDGVIPKDVKPKGFVCTADLAAYLRCQRSLKASTKHLLGKDISKETRELMQGKTYAQAVAEGMEKELLEYGCSDAVLCYELFDKYGELWPESERKYSEINRHKCFQGIPIHKEDADEGAKSLKTLLWETENKMPWIAEGKKPGSPIAIREQGKKDGIPVPASRAKTNQEAIEWYKTYGKSHPWVQAIQDRTSINNHMKKVITLRDGCRADGTFPLQIKYMGTHCVPGDVEVLTPTGWQALRDWGGGDIAQWSPGGVVEFARANKVSFDAFDKCGESMIRLDSPYAKVDMTAGHTVALVTPGSHEFKTAKAEDIGSRKTFYVPVSGELSHEGSITADQMRVLVATQADGHWLLNPKQGSGLQFFFSKSRKIDRLRELLEAVGISYRELTFASHPGFVRFAIRKSDIPAWLSPDRKLFGPWLLDSTAEARAAFAEEVLLWDGHRGEVDEYYSSIKSNAEWVATITHLVGKSCGKLSERGGSGNRQTSYRVRIRNAKQVHVVTKEHVAPTQPAEQVYCPQTKTGFWLARSEGTILVTGNTGRTSAGSADATGGKFNPLNLPRIPMFGVDLRGLIRAPEGFKFIIADYSQIEAILLAWIVGDKELLERTIEEGNLYQAYAKKVGWYKGNDLKGDDNAMYQRTKVAVLQLGYQSGWVKFKHIAEVNYGVIFTESEAKEIVTGYRNDNPKIVAYWDEHHKVAQFSCNHKDDTHEIALPSGRDLIYFNPRWRKTIRDGRSSVEMTMCPAMGARAMKVYGGLLTENTVQATARDVLKDARVAAHEAGHNILWDVYDEFIELAPEDEAVERAKALEKIMVSSSPWAKDCPLGVEYEITDRYKK